MSPIACDSNAVLTFFRQRQYCSICTLVCAHGLVQEGFIFKALGGGKFAAQQLASIKVSLSGTPRVKPRGESISALSVLLSLTGDGSFVRNAPVRPGDNHTFLGLNPGSYFLRPLLKEYQFEPPTHAVDLQSGEQLTVHFSATRVAYG